MEKDNVIPLARRRAQRDGLPESLIHQELQEMRAFLRLVGFPSYELQYGALVLECGPSLEYDAEGWHVYVPAGYGPLTGSFTHERDDRTIEECLSEKDDIVAAIRAGALVVDETVRRDVPTITELQEATFAQRGYPDGIRERTSIVTEGMRTRWTLDGIEVASVEDFFRLAWGVYEREEFIPLKLADADLILRAIPGRWVILGAGAFGSPSERYIHGTANGVDVDLYIRPGIARSAHEAFVAELTRAIAPLATRLDTLGRNIEVRRLERELDQSRADVDAAKSIGERRAAQRRERFAYRKLAEALNPSLEPSFEEILNSNRLSIDGR